MKSIITTLMEFFIIITGGKEYNLPKIENKGNEK